MDLKHVDPVYIFQLLTLVTGLWLANNNRRQTDANIALNMSQAAQNIVEMREADVKRLQGENEVRREYIEYLQEGILKLRAQIIRMNKKPRFSPISFLDFMGGDDDDENN